MKKGRRKETEEEWKRVKKSEGKKKKKHKMEEVHSGRWYYQVSLYCRPVVFSVFALIYMMIK